MNKNLTNYAIDLDTLKKRLFDDRHRAENGDIRLYPSIQYNFTYLLNEKGEIVICFNRFYDYYEVLKKKLHIAITALETIAEFEDGDFRPTVAAECAQDALKEMENDKKSNVS